MRLIRMSAVSRLTEFPGPPSYDNSLTPNKRCSSDRPPTPLPKIPKNPIFRLESSRMILEGNNCSLSLSPSKKKDSYEIPRFNLKIPSIRFVRARNSSNGFREFSERGPIGRRRFSGENGCSES